MEDLKFKLNIAALALLCSYDSADYSVIQQYILNEKWDEAYDWFNQASINFKELIWVNKRYNKMIFWEASRAALLSIYYYKKDNSTHHARNQFKRIETFSN